MSAGKFSRYEIREELGKGGMAEVYRAYDPLFGREVALKILRQEMVKDQKLRERFERETRIIASLEREGIVPVYDVGRGEDDQLFFVMRLMTGGSLASIMQNGPLPLEKILKIIQRIAPALDSAHQEGVIHRDLKPGNILFDGRGNAYIADFGIAKSNRIVPPDTLTNSSGILGTPRYMSPEQARGEPLDGRSDIYSLGVIAFEMLVGKTKFDTVTPLGLAFTQETDVIHRILDTNPSLPPGVQEVIEKVLAREREFRYETSVEFANALTEALSEPSPPTEELVRPVSRVRFWTITGFIVIALVIFSIYVYIKPPPPPPPTITTEAVSTLRTAIPLTETPAPTETAVTPTATVIPGGADKIAFTANDEIYLVNFDGSGIESLTKTGIPKLDLQWIPNTNELLYIEANCVNRIDTSQDPKEPEELICFDDSDFTGFRISPDGTRVAISIAGRLLVLPYDLETLSTTASAFELQRLDNVCMNYTDVTVKDALWSDDGKRLAIRYQSVVNGRIGDTIRGIQGNWARCQEADVFTWDEFPAERFTPDGYARYPILPSYSWDGDQRFLMNSFIRNRSYGDLYSYNLASRSAEMINPIDGACCYGSAAYSPDGTHMLIVFQDEGNAPDNETVLYYIPVDLIGTGEELAPLPVPSSIFEDWRENIQLALHPVGP